MPDPQHAKMTGMWVCAGHMESCEAAPLHPFSTAPLLHVFSGPFAESPMDLLDGNTLFIIFQYLPCMALLYLRVTCKAFKLAASQW